MIWSVLGAGVVAVLWIFGATNSEFGYVIPGLVTFGWLWFVRTWVVQWRARLDDEQRRATGLDQVDCMSGELFEEYVASVLRGNGYQASTTKASGDFGVDIVASRDGVRTAVQCKRYGSPVGGGAVQQAVAGAPMYDCTATMVVSNQSFTRGAQELAHANGCQLIGRAELESLALQAFTVDEDARASQESIDDEPFRRQLLAAIGVTVTVVLVCSGIALYVADSRRQAAAEREAAAKSAPCPTPTRDDVVWGTAFEKLVPIPDFAGDNADDAETRLEARGITNIDWNSVNPRYSHVIVPSNWTVVRTFPRAGCELGPADALRIDVTK